MRTTQRDEISAACGDDRIHLIGAGDRANRHGGNMGFIADAIREWRLEHATKNRAGISNCLTG